MRQRIILESTETIENINDLQARGKLNSHLKCGLVSSRKVKAWQMWWDVKYQMEVNKVSKTEAVKRVAAMPEHDKDVREVWRHLEELE